MAPAFFVPSSTPETQEADYADLAKACGVSLPKPVERIFSITYLHDREEWTATVGEQLAGFRVRYSRRRSREIERTTRLFDPAVVLAIFAGIPYSVFTNQGIGETRSRWANPFLVGSPTRMAYFAAAGART